MKKVGAIFIIMLLITGCSSGAAKYTAEKKDNNANNNNTEQINEGTPPTTVEQVLDNTFNFDRPEGKEIIIRDKLFIAQCNDIYLNPDEYKDNTIRWQGIYTESTNPQTNELYRFVIRYGPGCCGNDGVAGFEIMYDGETRPNQNDWVEAVGVIEMIEENGAEFVSVRLSELTILDERGQEFVSN